MIDESNNSGRSTTFIYVALSLIIVLYVAVVTDARSEHLSADAWEHHRAVVTLSQQL